MLNKTYSANITKAFKTIDWKLLLFLILFLNVKLVVKLAAILWIYLMQRDFKFGFRWENSRLPVFYISVILIGIFNWIIDAGFSNLHYSVAFFTGCSFWLMSLLAMHQVKLSVEQNQPAVIHQTVLVFFILNAVVSFAVYGMIVFKTGAINPYLYQGEYQKYFIGTGDYIRGISFDTSTTNAVINASGVIYFLSRKNVKMLLLCMVTLLLTGSNITNLLLSALLVMIFIFQSDRDQKSLITVCLLLLVVFLTKVSPQNNNYVSAYVTSMFHPGGGKPAAVILPIRDRPDSTLTPEERKEKTATLYMDSLYRQQENLKQTVHKAAFSEINEIPAPDINSIPYQHRSVLTATEERMQQFIRTHSSELLLSSDTGFHSNLPGKMISWEQTLHYFRENPEKIFTGAGTGNFSSKLAFRATGLDIAGGYPETLRYINPAFMGNHLDLYLSYFTKSDGFHSIANNPDSVYDQLLGEYGLCGFTAFLIFYVGFFARKYKHLTYGIPLFFLLMGIFFLEYWFEQLSVVIFFELLLFLNIREEDKNE